MVSEPPATIVYAPGLSRNRMYPPGVNPWWTCASTEFPSAAAIRQELRSHEKTARNRMLPPSNGWIRKPHARSSVAPKAVLPRDRRAARTLASDQRFRHLHEMEGNFHTNTVRVLGDARGRKAEPGVEALELAAVVDKAKFHAAVTGATAVLFGGCHQPRSNSRTLPGGIDGHKTDVRALAARLDVDAGQEGVILFEQQEPPSVQQFADALGVDAFTLDVGTLGHERAVHKADERVHVVWLGQADGESHARYFRGKDAR